MLYFILNHNTYNILVKKYPFDETWRSKILNWSGSKRKVVLLRSEYAIKCWTFSDFIKKIKPNGTKGPKYKNRKRRWSRYLSNLYGRMKVVDICQRRNWYHNRARQLTTSMFPCVLKMTTIYRLHLSSIESEL